MFEACSAPPPVDCRFRRPFLRKARLSTASGPDGFRLPFGRMPCHHVTNGATATHGEVRRDEAAWTAGYGSLRRISDAPDRPPLPAPHLKMLYRHPSMGRDDVVYSPRLINSQGTISVVPGELARPGTHTPAPSGGHGLWIPDCAGTTESDDRVLSPSICFMHCIQRFRAISGAAEWRGQAAALAKRAILRPRRQTCPPPTARLCRVTA